MAMIRSVVVCVAGGLALAGCSLAQSFAERSSVALSAGAVVAPGSYDFFAGISPVLNVAYEFKVLKYLSINAGDTVWFPYGYRLSSTASIPAGANLSSYTSAEQPFGLTRSRMTSDAVHIAIRGIIPLARGRVELFVGAGPGYDWLTRSGVSRAEDFVVDVEAGGRIALDQKQRFWLGASTSLLGNWWRDYKQQQWVSSTIDFEFRFGRR